MALLLSNPNDTLIIANNQINVFGTKSGTETVKILDNQFNGIHLDSSIETLELAANLNDYQFQLAGNVLQINAGSHLLVDISLDSTPIKLVFADGSGNVAISGLGNALLGTTQIPTIMQSLNGVFLDKTQVSTVSEIVQSFSIVQDLISSTITVPPEDLNKTVHISSSSTDDSGGNNFEDADNSAVTFIFESGSYLYTIRNFGEDDVLDIPDGSQVSIQNSNFSDGILDLYSTDNSGASFQIHLLGIDPNYDSQITFLNTFKQVFGDNSII